MNPMVVSTIQSSNKIIKPFLQDKHFVTLNTLLASYPPLPNARLLIALIVKPENYISLSLLCNKMGTDLLNERRNIASNNMPQPHIAMSRFSMNYISYCPTRENNLEIIYKFLPTITYLNNRLIIMLTLLFTPSTMKDNSSFAINSHCHHLSFCRSHSFHSFTLPPILLYHNARAISQIQTASISSDAQGSLEKDKVNTTPPHEAGILTTGLNQI